MKLAKSFAATAMLAMASWSASASTTTELSGHTFSVSGSLTAKITSGSCTANGYSASIPASASRAISSGAIFKDTIKFNANKTFVLTESGRTSKGTWSVDARGNAILRFSSTDYGTGLLSVYNTFRRATSTGWAGNQFLNNQFSAVATVNPTTKVLTFKETYSFLWKFSYGVPGYSVNCSASWLLSETLSGHRTN